MTLSTQQGRDIVAYARHVIEQYFDDEEPSVPESLIDLFEQPRGVFVTLSTHPGHELRGCIGYSEPVMTLGKAVTAAALAAALEDPRFPAVTQPELSGLTVEVSVLTEPEKVSVDEPKQYVDEVEVGRDGLIVESGMHKGLLLPQVPVEWKWDAEEFLSHTCMKAGLSTDAWLSKPIKLYRFTAQIFTEREPRGDILEKDIAAGD